MHNMFERYKKYMIKTLFVAGNGEPLIIWESPTMKSLQSMLGKVEILSLPDGSAVLVIKDSNDAKKLPIRRVVRNEEGRVMYVIRGNFYIVGSDGENFISLTDEQIEKYKEMFTLKGVEK